MNVFAVNYPFEFVCLRAKISEHISIVEVPDYKMKCWPI